MKFGSHRLLLHAEKLAFDHPCSGERLAFRVPTHNDVQQTIAALGWTDVLERRYD